MLAVPRVADSLAGRLERLTLYPLSQGEIQGRREGFLDAVFGDRVPKAASAPSRADVARRMLRGGYPEAYGRAEGRRRRWFASYITAVLQRDVRDLAHIEKLTAMPTLLAWLAARTGGLLNLADVGWGTGLPYATLHRYMALLQTTRSSWGASPPGRQISGAVSPRRRRSPSSTPGWRRRCCG